MAKYSVNDNKSPIIFLMLKRGLKKIDICRLLGISEMTLNDYIKHPYKIRLKDLYTLAGIYNVNILELIFLIERNKPQLKYKVNKNDFSFLVSDIEQKYSTE